MRSPKSSLTNKQVALWCHLSPIVASLARRIPWHKLDTQSHRRARTAALELERALRHAQPVRKDRAAIHSSKP